MHDSKACAKCGKTKPVSEFERVGNRCKQCAVEHSREWYLANREAANAKRRARNAANPQKARDQRAKRREARRDEKARWRLENKTHVLEYQRRQRVQNPHPHRDEAMRTFKRAQASTLPFAVRSGYEWTGWELELISNTDRTAEDLALEIRRSFAAVVGMRRKLHSDPQTISRAGISDSGRF
jgi:hypothetical protein